MLSVQAMVHLFFFSPLILVLNFTGFLQWLPMYKAMRNGLLEFDFSNEKEIAKHKGRQAAHEKEGRMRDKSYSHYFTNSSVSNVI